MDNKINIQADLVHVNTFESPFLIAGKEAIMKNPKLKEHVFRLRQVFFNLFVLVHIVFGFIFLHGIST